MFYHTQGVTPISQKMAGVNDATGVPNESMRY
jgi:hypothetical protein